jgi:ligand-binding SRPBCC domain-containing protein
MSRVFHLEQSQFIPRPRSEVFSFFADVSNLGRITPASVHFRLLTPGPIAMRPGALIDYELRLFGIPVRWRTRIESFDAPFSFTDIQLRGPYRRWHHRHEFIEVAGGTKVQDIVDYEMPFGPLGSVVQRLFVRRALENIFQHRRAAIAELFRSR